MKAYIVGGGPSLFKFDWRLLDNEFVVAINRAYEVLPRAQMIYFTDRSFWNHHQDELLCHHAKLHRGTLGRDRINHPDVREWTLIGETGISLMPGCLKHGKNSTYAAINLLCAHMGYSEIYLLGIDMKRDGLKTHWHDTVNHRIDPESIYKKMIQNFETLKPELRKLKVQVYNLVNDYDSSNLNCFPKIKIQYHFAK